MDTVGLSVNNKIYLKQLIYVDNYMYSLIWLIIIILQSIIIWTVYNNNSNYNKMLLSISIWDILY